MGSAFRGLSGLIDVDFSWRAPRPQVLRQPSAHAPRDSRVLFHETVHYWQTVGQGFPAKVIEEDWERLRRYEADGTTPDAGPYRCAFVEKHPEHGFSALHLHESLARFWDVHVIGPSRLLELEFEDPRRRIDDFFKHQYFAFKANDMIVHPEHGGYSDLAFDMAMSAAAGSYALPYDYVRGRYSSVVTGALFPLAGHFALQTERPVDVFVATIDAAASELAGVQPGLPIHELWQACFPLARVTCASSAEALGVAQIGMTAQVIAEGPLGEHPVYSWVFGELERGRVELEGTWFPQHVTQGFGDGALPKSVATALAVDFCLACPGDTTNRSFLVEWLAPPCVRFPDQRRWLLPELFRRELIPADAPGEEALSRERTAAADAAEGVQLCWDAFLKAKRGY